MELELNAKEVKQILLEWANAQFPGKFNEAKAERYGGFGSVTFSLVEPEKREDGGAV